MSNEFSQAIDCVMNRVHAVSTENIKLINYVSERRFGHSICLLPHGSNKTETLSVASVLALSNDCDFLAYIARPGAESWECDLFCGLLLAFIVPFCSDEIRVRRTRERIRIDFPDGRQAIIQFASINTIHRLSWQDKAGNPVCPDWLILDDPLTNDTLKSVSLLESAIRKINEIHSTFSNSLMLQTIEDAASRVAFRKRFPLLDELEMTTRCWSGRKSD